MPLGWAGIMGMGPGRQAPPGSRESPVGQKLLKTSVAAQRETEHLILTLGSRARGARDGAAGRGEVSSRLWVWVPGQPASDLPC